MGLATMRRRTVDRWNGLPIRVKGLVVISVPLALLVVNGVTVVALIRGQQGADVGSQQALAVTQQIDGMLLSLKTAEGEVRAVAVAPLDATVSARARRALAATGSLLDSLTRDSPAPELDLRFAEIARLARTALTQLEAQRIAVADHPQPLLAVDSPTLALVRADLTMVRRGQEALGVSQHAEEDRLRQLALVVAGVTLALGLVGGSAGSLLFTAGVTRRLHRVRDEAARLAAGETGGVGMMDDDDELGQVSRSLLTMMEASSLRQQELASATEEAVSANAMKDEFVSRMSHEFRTPLTAIIGFAQLLEVDTTNDNDREGVEQILRAGRHLTQLVNEVLDLSTVESGHLVVSLEPVHVAEVMTEVVGLVKPLAATQDVALDTGGLVSCSHFVRADRQRLQQVMLNLMSNAVKYNRAGGVVRLGCENRGGEILRIVVEDTGPGFDDEQYARVFTAFDRLGAETSGVGGTGLGLALAKRMTEAMGGNIGLDTVPGAGSRFWVELPFADDPVPALPLPQRQDRPPVAIAGTVLYIEDNLANVRLVERLLSRMGEVTVVSTMQGSLGLELAVEHQPQLVLLDLQLPDMNGIEALRGLKADPRTAAIPVVALTADPSTNRPRDVLAAGAEAFLLKPLDVEAFITTVAGLLDQGPVPRGQDPTTGTARSEGLEPPTF